MYADFVYDVRTATGLSEKDVLTRFESLTDNEKEAVHDMYSTNHNVKVASIQTALNGEYEESVDLIQDANRVFLNTMRGLWELVKVLAH